MIIIIMIIIIIIIIIITTIIIKQAARCSFYRAFNAILSGLGSNPPMQVALSLVRASCIPIIMYGLSAVSLSQSEINCLAFVFNNVFVKLFHIRDPSSIALCQYYCNLWPLRETYEFQRFYVLASHFTKYNVMDVNSMDYPDYLEMMNLASKYGFMQSDSKAKLKFKVWRFLESSLL